MRIPTPTRTRRRALALTALMLTALAPTACGDRAPDQSQLPPGHRVAERYASALNVELEAMDRRPTGLYVQDVREGDGARADSGDIVVVHYTGWLPGGSKFDSSRDRDQPFEVAIGYGRVIDGWDHGIVGMRVGGERRLVIPPALAYGETGTGPIPRNATLVFDVELLDVVNRTPEGEEDAGESEEGGE